jgi:uncharacterized membrane protein YkvA (DUF1232 family)
MSAFFSFLSTAMTCAMVFGIVSVIALSLPKSKLRTVLNEVLCWAAVVLAGLYVTSPVDLFPEAAFGPIGYVDDLGAGFLAWIKFKDAMKLRKQRREQDDLD